MAKRLGVSQLFVVLALGACQPPEVAVPAAVLGTWTGTCLVTGTADERHAIAITLDAEAPPAVALGEARLRDGRSLDCAGFAVSDCDLVLDGTLEGAIGDSWSEAYTAFSSFVWRTGETLRAEVTVMVPAGLFDPRFMCDARELLRE